MSDEPIPGLFEVVKQVNLPRLGIHEMNSWMCLQLTLKSSYHIYQYILDKVLGTKL